MNTPRTLPRGMHFKHGRYYLVVRQKWHPLPKDYDAAVVAVGELRRRLAATAAGTPFQRRRALVAKLLRGARGRARKLKREFSITVDDVMALGDASSWSCAITAIKFTIDRHETARIRPFYPSIDRIDSTKGYTADNCRLVCAAMNAALGEWGEKVFTKLAVGYITQNRRLLENFIEMKTAS